ncbi:polysaccharide biosynthesis/export family protein [Pseudooceanicola algae]|uniref:Uncharacterized protein n=1 Tax=Pseudooceanicola algae TaxID=1537215 RepID=A0A418SD90_9RHOB|nr:polysaccharide biosynthesis/export family protein [Pseudooceanicola algae]QPM92570.1 hypothetical protein PSAL_038340 [Pseudooceanicola algae]
MRCLTVALCLLTLAGCGVVYRSPTVSSASNSGSAVRVLPITPQNVLIANRSSYRPRTLPAIFSQTSGGGSALRGAGALPEPAVSQTSRPEGMAMRVPPPVSSGPYRIGVGDVLLLATPQVGNTVEQLTGLLAAQNARQGYTVQDDGAIAIPNVGRVQVNSLTLEDAEAELFQRLVENQIDPTFSLEVSEFNSKKVSIGGAVARPAVAPVTLTPLYLDEALAAAGGITVTDQDYASVRIYRDGELYQIPLTELYSNNGLQRIQLVDGDSVFVDTEYDLDMAQAYFEEQIRLAEYRQDARIAALDALDTEVAIRRADLKEARDNYISRTDLGAVERDYVYLTGEVTRQSRFALPFEQTAVLADALYSTGGMPTETGDASQIYVLRGSDDPREFAAVTAWRLDGSEATNLLLTTRFELRPNDIIFIAEQPITRWNRVIQQFVPSLITTPVSVVAN